MNYSSSSLLSPLACRLAIGLVLWSVGFELARAQSAQPQTRWVWINAGGVKTFSDVAPPAGTPDKNILSRPGQFASSAAGSASAAATALAASAPRAQAETASVPRVSGKDPELEKRLKADEADKKAADAAAEKAEQAKADAALKAACARAQRAATGLAAGGRIATTNAKGEREFLSDEQRTEALRKAQDNVTECNKLPQ